MGTAMLGKLYKDGEVIFREGDAGDRMFMIRSGTVRISKNTPTGMVTITTLGPGETFGEMALLDSQPRSATATAAGGAQVLGIDKKHFLQTVNRDATLALKILESMSRRMRQITARLASLDQTRSETLRACMSVTDTCAALLQEARGAIQADNGSIMLLNEASGKLAVHAGFGKEAAHKLELALGEGIAGSVLRSGKAELVNSVAADARFVRGTGEIRSLLCVPLQRGGKPLGVMNLSNAGDRVFTIQELRALHSMAVYAAIAIENARSYEALHDAAHTLIEHVSLSLAK
jgi:CRP-like cAMP-binding protein